MSRFRGWCFTLNNYTPFQEKALQDINCRYIIYGREIAPKTGTPHLQGYLLLPNAKSFKAVKKFIGIDSIHLEGAKGSPQQNIKYCSKDDNVFEKGDPPNMGKRNDLDDMRQAIKDGGNLRDVLDTGGNYQNIKVGEKYLTYFEKPRDFKPNVYWYWGKTGVGKTRLVQETIEKEGYDAYWCNSTDRWWDGYDGHDCIVIDDMRANFCSFNRLLKILDRYECRVEVKGGFRQLKAKHIFITSCMPPEEMYFQNTMDETRDRIEQLLRRITEIKNLTV